MNRDRTSARATVAAGAALLAAALATLATSAPAAATPGPAAATPVQVAAAPVLARANPAQAAATGAGSTPVKPVTWKATIDGRDVTQADGNDPINLHPGKDVRVSVSIDNRRSSPLSVRSVRLQGRVLGMAFFTFSTRVDLEIPAGATADRVIQLDLSDLGEQAVGLIPARLALIGPDRSAIDERSLATQIDGSLASAYGIFGLAIAAITLVLLIGLGLEIAGNRLPYNRWRRAVRFLSPGLGIGLTATFTVSATGVLLPGAEVWVPLVLGCGLAAFVVGYLTPRPDDDIDDRAPALESVHPWPLTSSG